VKITRGRAPDAVTQHSQDTFTGLVWRDPVLPPTDGVMINNVFFAPGARTNWHRHENGQVLHVTAGAGLICTEGERPQRLRAGDTVWVPPGETHWHGAGRDGYLLHLAISLGKTDWDRPVRDEEYGADGE
jgi:quercetin dioxygenase-like cupin family protein